MKAGMVGQEAYREMGEKINWNVTKRKLEIF